MSISVFGSVRVFAVACVCALALFGQSHASPARFELILERETPQGWRATPQNLVFHQGDRVRFRFRSNADGYLFVTDYGTSGQAADLLNASNPHDTGRIGAGAEKTIPEPPATFRIAGPPGYDVIYWVFTQSENPRPPERKPAPAPVPVSPEQPRPTGQLTPRCDEALLRARGDCLDLGAGARSVRPGETLPQLPGGANTLTPRDLVVNNDADHSVISAQAGNSPIVYLVRIAHN